MKKKVFMCIFAVIAAMLIVFNVSACSSYTKSLLFYEIQEGEYILSDKYSYLGDRVGEIEVSNEDRTIEKLIIPSKYKSKEVTTIGASAFKSCKLLTEVVLPNTLKYIEVYAFANCVKLTNLNFPDSVVYLSDYTFEGDVELASISIGRNMQVICPNAFKDCNKLQDVYYNGSQEDWNKIEILNGNECLLNATIHFAE